MNASFQNLEALASGRYGAAYTAQGEGMFAVALDGLALHFSAIPGDPSTALVRARLLDMAEVRRAGDFAKAALAGNFFWGGTRGATLSVGADGGFYATERRAIDELADADALDACLGDFLQSASDWRERSGLYA